jgi:hypothetical protein
MDNDDPWRAPEEGSPIADSSAIHPAILGLLVGISSTLLGTTCICMVSVLGFPVALGATGLMAMLAGMRVARSPGPLAASTPVVVGAITAAIQLVPWLLTLIVVAFLVKPAEIPSLAPGLLLAVPWSALMGATASAGLFLGFGAQRRGYGGPTMVGAGSLVLGCAMLVFLTIATIAALTVLGNSISSKFDTIAHDPVGG